MKTPATIPALRDWERTLLFWCQDFLPLFQERKDAVSCLPEIDPSLLILKRSAAAELFRKMGVCANFISDMSSIDHAQVLRRIENLRGKISQDLGLELQSRPFRILLRVDDFPSSQIDSEEFLKFHRIAAENGVPYLLAVTPFLERNASDRELSRREIEMLKQGTREGVEIALHGFTHHRRTSKPASELAGMPASELRGQLDRALGCLNSFGFSSSVFVAPFNSYDLSTLDEITARFPVFCGGPESIHSFGARMPSFFQGSFYLPSYRGSYDLQEKDLAAFEKMLGLASGIDVPVSLHWANEARNGFGFFEKFCRRFSSRIIPWRQLISRVQEMRGIAA